MASLSYQKRIAEGNITRWRMSDKDDLYKAYGTCSTKKRSAWEYCKNKCHELNGRNLKVISANTYMFTAGFEFTDATTGEAMFMYISPNYDVAVNLA